MDAIKRCGKPATPLTNETVKRALGIEPDHLIVGFIHLGTDTGATKTRPPRVSEEYVRRWTGMVAT